MNNNGNTSSSLPTRHDDLTADGFGLSVYCDPDATYIYVTLPATIPAEWQDHGVTACSTREYSAEAMPLPDAVVLGHALIDEARDAVAAFPAVLQALYDAEFAVDEAHAALSEAKRAVQDALWDVEEARP